MRLPLLIVALVAAGGLTDARAESASPRAPAPHNVIIFVADGLRGGSLNEEDTPTLLALSARGVDFTNTHAMLPTLTAANAAAIATGHYPGDTGVYGDVVHIGRRAFSGGNFGRSPGSSTPALESDALQGDLDERFDGNYLGEESLLALARAHGFSTAVVGKLGPTGMQDVTQLAPNAGRFAPRQTILIDDLWGIEGPRPDPQLLAMMKAAGLPAAAPPRELRSAGSRSGAHVPNVAQQEFFLGATTQVVLPLLLLRARPFILVYWSRDPDGTQRSEEDSLQSLSPGINGPTSRAAVRNADDNLRQILAYVKANPGLAATTDIVVVSDHGAAAVDKHEVDLQHHATSSFSATRHYADVPDGQLPSGFLAIDLAEFLHQPLYDPDSPQRDAAGQLGYTPVRTDDAAVSAHPLFGNGLIGGSGRPQDALDAEVIVTANGGADLIYLPHHDLKLAHQLVAFLAGRDYVGALLVDDSFGPIAGSLPFSAVNLHGSSPLLAPAIVVAFKSLLPEGARTASAAASALQNAAQIADTPLSQGQGTGGGVGWESGYNFLAAIGPDFKQHYRDALPVSTADIAPTLMQVLSLPPRPRGQLMGRALDEVLRTDVAHAVTAKSVIADSHRSGRIEHTEAGRAAAQGSADADGAGDTPVHCLLLSAPASDGRRTILTYQRYQGRFYFDRAEFRAAGHEDVAGCRG